MLTITGAEMAATEVDAQESIKKIKEGAIIVPFEGQYMAWEYIGDEICEDYPVSEFFLPIFDVEGTFRFMHWKQYWVLSPLCFQYWKNLFTLRFLNSIRFAVRRMFDNGKKVYW